MTRKSSKISPKSLKIEPRSLKIGPRAPKIGPRAPKIGPRAPKIGPRAPKIAPRWPQEPPKSRKGKKMVWVLRRRRVVSGVTVAGGKVRKGTFRDRQDQAYLTEV